VKINRIGISNFRQYRNVEVDLSSSRGYFAVIRGLNGAGKTNLLKAITWCVTGDLGRSEPKHTPGSLVSFGAITEAAADSKIAVSVTIDIDLGLGGSAEIARSAVFGNASDGPEIHQMGLTVRTHVEGQGWQTQPEPDLWVDQQLPRRFSHYFLFDGEQLEKFFKETEARFVRDAVLEIAQVDHLERMVDRLQQAEGEITKSLAHQKSGENGSQLVTRYRELEESESNLKTRVAEKSAEKIDNETAMDDARSKLGDIQAAQSESKRLKSLETAAGLAHERAIVANSDFFAWSTAIAPYMLMFNAISGLEDQIEDARARKELPPAYDPDALRELLKNGTCVCGKNLDDGGEAHVHISRLVEEFSTLSEIGDLLRKVETPLARLRGRFFDQRDQGANLGKARGKAQKDATEADTRFEALQKQLVGHDDKKIAVMGQAFERAFESAKTIEKVLARLERDLDDTKKARIKLQAEIEMAGAKDAKAKVRLHDLAFTKQVLATSLALFDQLKDQVRQNVAANLNSEFQTMIWKKNAFEPIQIDEDYRVKVINRQGFQNLNVLSAGETACLAFAFALTLSKVAGVKYPMVVDSPLGRLSGDVKQSVADVLSRFLVGESDQASAQLLMLVTDEEYDESVEEVLSARNPLVFDIHFDQESGEAKIEESLGD
jgi:DNA sulfur modification protein DndD